MKRLILAAIVAVSINVTALAVANVLCFFSHEGPSTGMRKICYYSCDGELTAITISSVSVCPLIL